LKACQISGWWNPQIFSEIVSPYPIHYLPLLWRRMGWEVEILTRPYPIPGELREVVERKKLGKGYPERKVEREDGLTVRRFPGGRALSSLRMLRHLARASPSLVHLHSLGIPEDLGFSLLCGEKGIPLVFSHHAASLPDVLVSRGVLPSLHRTTLRFMNATGAFFVAFTDFQAGLYRGLGMRRVVTIPHGMDPGIFRVRRRREMVEGYLGEFTLLHAGFFEPRKGQEILIRCMPSLLRECPGTSLVLVGKNLESPYLYHLQGLCRRLGVRERVHFLRASREELIQLYLHSDLFAFPTTGEIFGHVYLEAMAAGCPVITTDKPVAREILQDGRAGVLVERSVGAFERGILELMGDPELRRRLARNARRAVEQKFELRKILRKWQELYRSLI